MVDWIELTCELPSWRLIMAADIIFLSLLGYSFLLVQPGTAAYVMIIINLLMLIPLLVLSIGMIRFCSKRKDV